MFNALSPLRSARSLGIIAVFVLSLTLTACSKTPPAGPKSTAATPRQDNALFIRDGNVELGQPNNAVRWSVTIVQGETSAAAVSAADVTVTAELRDRTGSVTVTGTTDGTGTVRWERPSPRIETNLFVTALQLGSLTWARDDAAAYRTLPVATFTGQAVNP